MIFGPDVTINCETGAVTQRTKTPSEIDVRLAEITEQIEEEEKLERKIDSARLVQVSMKLDKIKALKAEGIDAGDVAALQKQVDDLKAQLKAKPMEL